ncbi:hypothetical protein PVAG01_03363 [Phlyctema vagabunda]|uniref:Uncharacterized protein n=1 Tax=Phlyctema vagabunda TaxID=108571 RepID=A0ABR4PL67_9HELO
MLFPPPFIIPCNEASSQVPVETYPSSGGRTLSSSMRACFARTRRERSSHEDGGMYGPQVRAGQGKVQGQLRDLLCLPRLRQRGASAAAQKTSFAGAKGGRHVVEVIQGKGHQGWMSLSGREADADEDDEHREWEMEDMQRVHARQQRRAEPSRSRWGGKGGKLD